MKTLPKQYDHKEAEPRLQHTWEESGVYDYDSTQPRENTFVIDTPPPTVSGVLHMGHIFSYTQADFVARYQRMRGKTVFYPMGFDDNGLPTERLVEKIRNVRGSSMPRDAFVALCREVVVEAEDQFRSLFRSTALSVDWSKEYQTNSDRVRKLSQESFLDLLQKGQAYRDFRPTYWDWVDQTAIAQAEIENKEMPGAMHEIAFALEDAPLSRERERVGVRGTQPQWKNPKELVENARDLRKNSTDVEYIVWSCLRDRQLAGFKFRRQHPVEQYVADFACIEASLIVELDGSLHNEEAAHKKDEARTAFLQQRGFTVLRFWNNDVTENLEGVLTNILSALESASPHPNPLPHAGEGIVIATTRPELLGACVAVMYHPDDPNAVNYKGKVAISPVFGVKVPMIADELVERDKGTGLVMCCTFGDDTDKEWQRIHQLPTRPILGLDGRITVTAVLGSDINDSEIHFQSGKNGSNHTSKITSQNVVSLEKAHEVFRQIVTLKPKQANAKMLELLTAEGKLLKSTPITHTVKCAERSGTPIEIIPTYQWFVRITDKKEALIAKGAECNWYPEFMRIRLNQWIEGLKEDWCISRQRFFGVPFPVWYSTRAGEEGKIILPSANQLPVDPLLDLPEGYTRDEVQGSTDVMDTWATSSISPQINAGAIKPPALRETRTPSPSGRGLGEGKKPLPETLLSRARDLRHTATDAEQYMWAILRDRQIEGFKFRRQHPIPPYIADFFCHEAKLIIELDGGQHNDTVARQKDAVRTHFLESQGFQVLRFWNKDVLQNTDGVMQVIWDALAIPHPSPLPEGEGTAYDKLFPADLRPQAHEIIRTWAFYTIVKAHLHANTIPWKHVMISGWCLAADKSKMSKSKGNVITPEDLIRDKGADVVRYWTSTSRLGSDTAFSEDLLKIGKKLVTKIWNATQFASIHLTKLNERPINSVSDIEQGKISELLDKWILSRLHETIVIATKEFERFEYCDARVAIEEFFWKDFCDNYLELVKARAYGEIGDTQAHASAHRTLYYCLDALLRLFAPFVPHITEELFSHIFDGEGSVHKRGSWPDAALYPADTQAELAGVACMSILNAVRKAKSERNVSIKFPIERCTIAIRSGLTEAQCRGFAEDLRSAGTIAAIEWSATLPEDYISTEDKAFDLSIVWGEAPAAAAS